MDGIRVLDLTHVLAGPFCTYQLGLMGADVIKIENPRNPDCARGRGPDSALNAAGLGLTYQVQGANKRSLALDLARSEGADIFRTLVQDVDVVVENYTTGALDRLGLGYDALAAINPRLINCAITGFGDSGPQATHGAYDNVIQAASGTIGQCGGVKPGVSFVDYATGYAAAFAIAAALTQRQQTGKGAHISVSMLEVAMQMMAPEAAAAQNPAAPPKRKEAGIAAYDTKDGRLMLGSFHPAQYRTLAAVLDSLGQPVPALATVYDWPDVWALPAKITDRLAEIFRTADTVIWLQRLRAADLPVEPVRTLTEAVDTAQLVARGYFQENPANPAIALPTAAFHIAGSGASLHRAPPALGQHTSEILRHAGLPDAEINRLFDEKVVA